MFKAGDYRMGTGIGESNTIFVVFIVQIDNRIKIWKASKTERQAYYWANYNFNVRRKIF